MTTSRDQSSAREGLADDSGASFGFHVVALVDFLGQAHELMKWDYLPQNEEEANGFLPAVRNTYGRIMVWRKQFEKHFTTWLVPAGVPSWVVDPDPKDVETFQKYQQFSLGFMHFSDTIVVYSPLTNQHGYLKVDAVCSMIVTCGILMLAGLAQKTVFRCAIEMGMAGCFPETDLYGPALAKVHHLESRVADYPRIVVGPMLCQYLETHRQNGDQDAPARFNRWLADLSLRLLAQDTDGEWIVDYLGQEFQSLSRRRQEWGEVRRMASGFVTSELHRFRAEKNEKLTGKYARLSRYFESREEQ